VLIKCEKEITLLRHIITQIEQGGPKSIEENYAGHVWVDHIEDPIWELR